MAWLSVLGLYNFNEDLFKNMIIPENVDRDVLIDTIIYDNAELGLIYADYEVMTDLIGVWSRSELDIWDRLNKAFNEEYNPIWNVDENTTETKTIDRQGTDTKDITGSNQSNTNLTITDNSTTTITNNTDIDSTTTNSVKGYNSNTWADHDQSVLDSSQTDKGSNVLSGNQTNVGVQTGTDTANEAGSHEETITETFNRRRGGNIGVTMSQQLLEAELETRPKLNIYKYISNSFKERFCLMIY